MIDSLSIRISSLSLCFGHTNLVSLDSKEKLIMISRDIKDFFGDESLHGRWRVCSSPYQNFYWDGKLNGTTVNSYSQKKWQDFSSSISVPV